MSWLRTLVLGALAGLSFTAILITMHLVVAENGLYAGLVFIALGPFFDRFAFRISGDGGPRIFWSAAVWMVLPLVAAMRVDFIGQWPGYEHFGEVLWSDELGHLVIIAPIAAAFAGAVARTLGFRKTILRRIAPWGAIAATVFVGGLVAEKTFGHGRMSMGEILLDGWYASAMIPVIALVSVLVAGVALFRGAQRLAKVRGLEGAWRHGAMSADGLVTVDTLPPMHAPAGIVPLPGQVLVELDAESVATFRTTGAPKILRLLQGVDADLGGRRAILDEGARAYAIAAALLGAVATYAVAHYL